jgi:hypothetical protein
MNEHTHKGGGSPFSETSAPRLTPATFGEEKSLRESGGVRGFAYGEVMSHELPWPGKWCRECHFYFAAAGFRPNPRIRDGLHTYCKSCERARHARWRVEHPEVVEAYNASRRAAYQVANPPALRNCSECGEAIVGRPDRVVCGKRACKDRRFRRLHPEANRAKQRRKYQRRKQGPTA